MTENQITKNVLSLKDIQKSENYTCIAQSTLGIISTDVQVKVQGMYGLFHVWVAVWPYLGLSYILPTPKISSNFLKT